MNRGQGTRARVAFARAARAFLIAVGALIFASGACAATGKLPPDRPGKIPIEYLPPKEAKFEDLYKLLKERQVLEDVRMVLSAFKLPRDITLRLKGCDGRRNAWYDDEDYSITVCYEYLQDVVDHAPKDVSPEGVTRRDAIVGPTAEVFLHEGAHMLFHQYHMPLLGPEEDSADAVAAYTMMQFGPRFARSAISGVAYMYARKAKDQAKTFEKEDLAEEHPLTGARFYTLLCFAYGGQPKNFQFVVDRGYLPEWRAKNCDGDYERIQYAVQTLFRPHMDPAKAKQVRAYFEKKAAAQEVQPAAPKK
ncbi:MAG TPA: DUF4344 domain-containing metallopeptidase [Burkholderiales bacterium]|nr:DUF4344 domain-containing metallopeptidase [Burkholderiales bacterium]